jgi:broad specificity phosphatase PhoE
MRARALRAIEWVMARPDGKLVALVAHGHFLLALTGARVRIVKTAWWYDGMVA